MQLNVTAEELRKYSIMIGTPMFGGKCEGLYTKSTNELATLLTQYGVKHKFYHLFNESLIQRARNYIVDEFLRSDCTHLMFIDADISFKASDVLALLAVQVTFPENYDIVTAPYAKKTIAWEKVHQAAVTPGVVSDPNQLADYGADYVFNLAAGTTKFRLDEPTPVSEAGTGFMLIPRSVFDRYKAAYPQYSYLPDHTRTDNFDGSREIMAYFDCQIDPESRIYLSEDYFFCRNAGKIGIKTHMCPWIYLIHIGWYAYRGSLPALAQLGASPTASPTKQQTKPKQKVKGFRP